MKTKTRTKNRYVYPVSKESISRISYTDSPAHIGVLRYSIDFIVPIGTEVSAAADGRVVDLKKDGKKGGNNRKFEKEGNFIELYHKNEEYSEYEHLSKVTVKIGDFVKKGHKIGYSGTTGWLGGLGPHLHFMVGVYENYRTLKIEFTNKT